MGLRWERPANTASEVPSRREGTSLRRTPVRELALALNLRAADRHQIGCDTRSLFEAFTEQARAAIGSAQREARDMRHGEVHVEHLLLGLFSPQSGLDPIWTEFGLVLQPVRDTVRERLGPTPGTPPDGQLSFSPAAKDVLRSAYRFPDPTAEHILIAVIGRGEGGSEILTGLGADPRRIRRAAKQLASPFVQGPVGRMRGTVRATPPEFEFGD
jgi:Clp amino terminal domain, pathogenicity island component